jgi:acylphosphatase
VIRVRLVALGRVQGVNFRVAALRRAAELGIVGWVRNVENGSVEAVAEGREAAIDEFIAWMRGGPPAARVDELRVTREEPTGEFERFYRA